MKTINSYDIDGCIFINKEVGGIHPGPHDVIISGRSFEEKEETHDMLHKRGILNVVYLNPQRYEEKTRITSGEHKARTIKNLFDRGIKVQCHFEDDEIQAAVIRRECPDVHVVMIVHSLTNKENERHLEY
jgi:hypothetical protein